MKTAFRFTKLVLFYMLVLTLFLFGTYLGSLTVTAITDAATIAEKTHVVIDPGHGGEDGGTTSCTGILECTINLEISKRLDSMMHLLGYRTVLVRDGNYSVYTEGETIAAKKASDLKQRVKLANSTPTPLLISIHQNYFYDSKYSGAQVFYAGTAGSMDLAKALQQGLVTSLNPASRRQAKKASGIYLLDHISCTGILVECGFLSNPEEERKLIDPQYQKKLCGVIATVVCNFLDRTKIS